VKRIFVPTLLTLGNGVCGFAAIAYASKISHTALTSDQVCWYYFLASALIFLAMVFDLLDGYAARLTRCASEFGGQLDSLCDAISFGAAPAFLLLRMGQEWENKPLIARTIAVVAALYLACAVVRLARFNTENSPDPASHKRFKGLPSPAAAGCLASLAILRSGVLSYWHGEEALVHDFVKVWAPFGALVASLLMVSRLSYPHFTRQLVRGRNNFHFVLQAVVLLAVLALAPEVAFFLVFWVYALNAPARYLILRAHRRLVPAHSPRLD
jgi:CDP-diacylglycerol--serine O-phosphatidyltransferase